MKLQRKHPFPKQLFYWAKKIELNLDFTRNRICYERKYKNKYFYYKTQEPWGTFQGYGEVSECRHIRVLAHEFCGYTIQVCDGNFDRWSNSVYLERMFEKLDEKTFIHAVNQLLNVPIQKGEW